MSKLFFLFMLFPLVAQGEEAWNFRLPSSYEELGTYAVIHGRVRWFGRMM